MEPVNRELTTEDMELINGGAGTQYVTTANVRLRSSKSTSSSANIIVVIPSGKKVTVLSKSGSWCKVRYNGQTGYVSDDYLQEA